jgi:alpha-amylase
VAVKEPGLSAYLHYDDHERRGALVRLLDPGLAPDVLRDGGHPDRLAIDEPWTLVRLGQDRVDVRREGAGLTLERRLRIGGPRGAPWLEVEVEATATDSPVEADLGLEWSICLSGGGANPAAWYEVPTSAQRTPHDGSGDLPDASALAFGNDDDGVRVDATLDPPGRVTWFPIETVSNSEGGFERVYQGSSLLIRWPLRLAAGGTATMRLRLAVRESRDRAAEETSPTARPAVEA